MSIAPATGAVLALDVVIEARVAAAFPVASFVVINSRPTGHQAEKDMLRRFDDDTDVSSPNHQISGFWLLDSFEGINAGVEIRRRRIGIRKPGLLVNAVHQVGAIGVGTAANPGV